MRLRACDTFARNELVVYFAVMAHDVITMPRNARYEVSSLVITLRGLVMTFTREHLVTRPSYVPRSCGVCESREGYLTCYAGHERVMFMSYPLA